MLQERMQDNMFGLKPDDVKMLMRQLQGLAADLEASDGQAVLGHGLR
jgi:hypothetical protein